MTSLENMAATEAFYRAQLGKAELMCRLTKAQKQWTRLRRWSAQRSRVRALLEQSPKLVSRSQLLLTLEEHKSGGKYV